MWAAVTEKFINTHSFLTALEAEKSKIKAAADLVSGEHRLPGPGFMAVFLQCAHVENGVRTFPQFPL